MTYVYTPPGAMFLDSFSEQGLGWIWNPQAGIVGRIDYGSRGGPGIDMNVKRQVLYRVYSVMYEWGGEIALWSPTGDDRSISLGLGSRLNGLNDQGTIVGAYFTRGEDSRPYQHPFRWTETGGIEELPLLNGARNGEASHINMSGVIVGTIESKAAIWMPATSPMLGIAELTRHLDDMIAKGRLRVSDAHPLFVRLDNASRLLDQGNAKAAGNLLGAFTNQIEALVRSRRMAPADGQSVRDAVACVRARI